MHGRNVKEGFVRSERPSHKVPPLQFDLKIVNKRLLIIFVNRNSKYTLIVYDLYTKV